MTAYYNENDHKLCDWLRELMKHGHIAPGRVDGRSIVDVSPDELRGYTQCHFFAGIGGWSAALRLAGWPDDRPVWTGSCPCQPFSTAGKRKGTADERHLWPAWFWLIEQCRPPVIFGEQVEAAISHGWLDLVSDDLEGIGYAVGPVPFPACSVGAQHKRQRVYFVADTEESDRRGMWQEHTGGRITQTGGPSRPNHEGREGREGERGDHEPEQPPAERGGDGGVGKPDRERCYGEPVCICGGESRQTSIEAAGAGPTNGFWANAEWLPCRDGKYRAVEPGSPPLAHGVPARMVRLRGYGNAIVVPQAAAFIEAYMSLFGEGKGSGE